MSTATAQILRLPAIFGDHMVLQRDAEIRIWGWAGVDCSIRVEFAGQARQTLCGADGQWRLELKALPASAEGREMKIIATGGKLAAAEQIILRDILVGDVWLCSGQSNMDMTLEQTKQAPQPANPNLRLFRVGQCASPEPVDDVVGQWKLSTPENAQLYSAVAYWFGEHLQPDIGVPVGLVNPSWGGTQAELWMSRDALEGEPAFAKILARASGEFKTQLPTEPYKDRGNEGLARGFAEEDHAEAANWPTMDIPRYWETTGLEIDGAVWFRRDVDVPADWAGRDLTLELGALDDFDTTYFNGVEVGRMGLETPNFWDRPRIYTVPGKLVKPGRNVIAIRIFDQWGPGGFAGRPEQMKLRLASVAAVADPGRPASPRPATEDTKSIPLAGPWRWQIELALQQRRSAGGAMPATVLYKGMIAPLVTRGPLAVRGTIWYQGESNSERAYQYRKLLPALITNWRKLFRQPEMPFLIVQLCNYKARVAEPQNCAWAELREAQDLAARTMKNVGLAVAIDVGEGDDIHPKNKKAVGQRLALEAGRIVYARTKTSGPRYLSHTTEGGAIRVRFHLINGELATTDGKPLRGFALAGADKAFTWAEAKIVGPDTVVISSAKIKTPVAVRYAWADNPDCNLCDAEKLPAAPFRTDDWPGVTVGAE